MRGGSVLTRCHQVHPILYLSLAKRLVLPRFIHTGGLCQVADREVSNHDVLSSLSVLTNISNPTPHKSHPFTLSRHCVALERIAEDGLLLLLHSLSRRVSPSPRRRPGRSFKLANSHSGWMLAQALRRRASGIGRKSSSHEGASAGGMLVGNARAKTPPDWEYLERLQWADGCEIDRESTWKIPRHHRCCTAGRYYGTAALEDVLCIT